MILLQIATALAIGAYVVLSKDAQPTDANHGGSFQHPTDHLDCDGRPELSPCATCVYAIFQRVSTETGDKIYVLPHRCPYALSRTD